MLIVWSSTIRRCSRFIVNENKNLPKIEKSKFGRGNNAIEDLLKFLGKSDGGKMNHNHDFNHNEDAKGWKVRPSKIARTTRNYIREVVENLNLTPNPEKDVIALSIDDPCVYGNIRCPDVLTSAMVRVEVVTSGCYNGYAASSGHMEAREALAEYMFLRLYFVPENDYFLNTSCLFYDVTDDIVIGDPCVYGNIRCPDVLTSAMVEVVTSGCYNGYAASSGHMEAREALAEYMSHSGVSYQPTDVMMYSGCSGALENCIAVLADGDEGHNIVIPKPGFAIYRTLAEGIGVKCKFYNLMPHKKWQADLIDLESQIDSRTAAIVVNNPSNPCGSVYSADHLRAILEVASRHRVPVIADEIYERLVFPGKEFTPMAALGTDVPLLICGGLSKRFLVPGWRMGWVVIHDPVGAFDFGVRKGLHALSTRIIGSCTLTQGAMVKFLNNVPQSYYDDLINTLYENAKICYEIVKEIPGLNPIMPDGAMYMMVEIEKEHFPAISNTSDFVGKLMEEESVFCLPGECFEIPYFMRLVITPPADVLREACKRMSEFCARYYT